MQQGLRDIHGSDRPGEVAPVKRRAPRSVRSVQDKLDEARQNRAQVLDRRRAAGEPVATGAVAAFRPGTETTPDDDAGWALPGDAAPPPEIAGTGVIRFIGGLTALTALVCATALAAHRTGLWVPFPNLDAARPAEVIATGAPSDRPGALASGTTVAAASPEATEPVATPPEVAALVQTAPGAERSLATGQPIRVASSLTASLPVPRAVSGAVGPGDAARAETAPTITPTPPDMATTPAHDAPSAASVGAPPVVAALVRAPRPNASIAADATAAVVALEAAPRLRGAPRLPSPVRAGFALATGPTVPALAPVLSSLSTDDAVPHAAAIEPVDRPGNRPLPDAAPGDQFAELISIVAVAYDTAAVQPVPSEEPSGTRILPATADDLALLAALVGIDDPLSVFDVPLTTASFGEGIEAPRPAPRPWRVAPRPLQERELVALIGGRFAPDRSAQVTRDRSDTALTAPPPVRAAPAPAVAPVRQVKPAVTRQALEDLARGLRQEFVRAAPRETVVRKPRVRLVVKPRTSDSSSAKAAKSGSQKKSKEKAGKGKR